MISLGVVSVLIQENNQRSFESDQFCMVSFFDDRNSIE